LPIYNIGDPVTSNSNADMAIWPIGHDKEQKSQYADLPPNG
jgi:hypothetical protein